MCGGGAHFRPKTCHNKGGRESIFNGLARVVGDTFSAKNVSQNSGHFLYASVRGVRGAGGWLGVWVSGWWGGSVCVGEHDVNRGDGGDTFSAENVSLKLVLELWGIGKSVRVVQLRRCLRSHFGSSPDSFWCA